MCDFDWIEALRTYRRRSRHQAIVGDPVHDESSDRADISYVFAGLVVTDRDRAAGWYARLLGRPADMLPNEAEAAWQLTSSASVYLLADPERAGYGVLTLMVADLDARLAEITARGITPGPIDEFPAGRKSVITDPDGNTVALTQLAG